jgi:SAM-dependent methyltransferase
MKPSPEADKTAVTEEAMASNPVHGVLPPSSGARRQSGLLPASNLKSKYSASAPSLWTAFWREFCLEDQPHERCPIPGDGRQAVDRHWADFADGLPPAAQVIDLGCGAGIVGRTLLNHRNDLSVTGIDFANVPALDVANLTIHPWVSMEALPFDDGCFDAAVSLFGIEYSSIDETARELGRVLKAGATFSFLVHHHESEIVCEGGTRRRALRELLSGKVRAAFLAGSMAGIDQQIRRLKNLFPGDPSITHFSRYLLHKITCTRTERQVTWQGMLDGLNPEIALLTHLERSAKSPVEMGNWLASLLRVMKLVSVSVLRRRSGQPIAWQVDGNR